MSAERKPRSIAQLMKLALSHHQAGRLREAKARYKQILRLEPNHADALNLSGLVAHQNGQTQAAIALITRATSKEPRVAIYYLNLGTVLESHGELEKAIAHYRQAALLDTSLPWAHKKIGDALLKQGNLSQAAASYSQELRTRPECHETINNLGGALHKAGKFKEAIVCYRKAISLHATYAEAYNNLGVALNRLDQRDDAIASYNQALLYKPDYADAYCNLGNALTMRGDFTAAVPCCRRAIELRPEFAAAYMHLGNAYKGLGLLSEAVSSYQRASSLAPNDGGVHNNLGVTFRDQGELQKAVESFHRALETRPAFTAAYSSLLYFYAFTRYISPAAERVLAQGWEKVILSESERAAARQRARAGAGTFPLRPRSGRKLRLGIVTAELGQHSVAEFLEPFLELLDRSRFDLTLFPTASFAGSRAQRLCQLTQSLIPLGALPDAQAAESIRSQQIDVLIETTGHTHGSRLGIFAHRAAPVQCSYIGYWSTTGLTEMDWFITGSGCDQSFDAHFTEGLWRLPRLAHCYKGDPSLPEGGWAPDPEGTIWLGSFNNYAKIRDETLGLWARVLHAIPQANLLFEDRALHDEETHRRISVTLSGRGISENRIAFIPYVRGHERHMMLYDRLDIALDTFPFNSGTTAFDTLWMGVPLITMKGNWLGGTLSSAVLTAFDHPEWVARDAEDYITIVHSLARDVEGRKNLRKSQRTRMANSSLCDAHGTARALEEAFEVMYDRWSSGAQPIPS